MELPPFILLQKPFEKLHTSDQLDLSQKVNYLILIISLAFLTLQDYSGLRFICPPSEPGKSGHIKRVFINAGILTEVSYEVKLEFGTREKWAYKAGFY